MGALMDIYERIERGTAQYILNRVTKSMGKGNPCPECGGETVAYEGMDECPKCNKLIIRMRRRGA